MSQHINRRWFLGGSIAASAAAVTGLNTLPRQAQASTTAKAFHYGPKPGIAKLNANENPYGPSPAAIQAVMQATSEGGAYYAYDTYLYLRDMIAEKFGLVRENVSISAGSSGVLSYAAVAAAEKGKILGPDLFWDTTANAPQRQGGAPIKRIAKTTDLSIDLDALYAAIDDEVAMVHVTNPNNPTGTEVNTEKLKEFCVKASKKTLVLVDEAYNELTDNPEKTTMAPLVKQGHNVIVARTFSKIYGLAGMRVGYMLASEKNIEWIDSYGIGGYAMNQAGMAAAIACFNDDAFLSLSKSKIIEAKQIVTAALKTNGLTALPSSTNFMFVNLGQGDAEVFRKAMEKRNVLIRGIYRDYTSWSRVSMGNLKDVQKYINALPESLAETYAAVG